MSKHSPHPFFKRPLLFVLAMAMMLVIFPITASASDYEGHWAQQYIEKAGAQGWMSGYPDGTFRPDNSISRAEFSAMLWRAQGSPAPGGGSPFADVAEDAWYYDAVIAQYEAGVVSGIGDDIFAPDDVVTREMGFTMLARALGFTPNNPEAYTRFADSGEVSAWASNAVSALTERGYISGSGDNQCAPGKALTRGEMAKLLVTVFDGEKAKSAPSTPSTPADTEGTDENGPVITLSYSPTGTTSGSVTVTVKASSDSEVTYIGMRSSSSGATYSNNDGFTDITKAAKFSVSSNGWYAVCALDKDSNFSYKLIQITNISKSTGGGGGSSGGGTTSPTVITTGQSNQTYNKAVIIVLGATDMVFDNVTFNEDVTIADSPNVAVAGAQKVVFTSAPLNTLLAANGSSNSKVTFKGNSQTKKDLKIKTKATIETEENVITNNITVDADDVELDLAGEVNEITVGKDRTVNKIKFSKKARHAVIKGDGKVDEIDIDAEQDEEGNVEIEIDVPVGTLNISGEGEVDITLGNDVSVGDVNVDGEVDLNIEMNGGVIENLTNNSSGTTTVEGTGTVNNPGGSGTINNNTGPPIANTYTVTYNANGGAGDVPVDDAAYEENETVKVLFTPAPTSADFDFLGWAKTAGADEPEYTADGVTTFTMGTANVTLYAVWGNPLFTLAKAEQGDNGSEEYVSNIYTSAPAGGNDYDVYFTGDTASVKFTFRGAAAGDITYAIGDGEEKTLAANGIITGIANNNVITFTYQDVSIKVFFASVARMTVNVGNNGSVEVDFSLVANKTAAEGTEEDDYKVSVAANEERSWLRDINDKVTFVLKPEEGYVYDSVTVNGVDADFKFDRDAEYFEVIFADAKQYTIDVSFRESFVLAKAEKAFTQSTEFVSDKYTPATDSPYDYDVYFTGTSASVKFTFAGATKNEISYTTTRLGVTSDSKTMADDWIEGINSYDVITFTCGKDSITVFFASVARMTVVVGSNGDVEVEFTDVINPTPVEGSLENNKVTVKAGKEQSWLLDKDDRVKFESVPDDGYVIDKIIVNEVDITQNAEIKFTEEKQYTITVTFKPDEVTPAFLLDMLKQEADESEEYDSEQYDSPQGSENDDDADVTDDDADVTDDEAVVTDDAVDVADDAAHVADDAAHVADDATDVTDDAPGVNVDQNETATEDIIG